MVGLVLTVSTVTCTIDLIDYVYRIGNFNVIEWVRDGQRL